MHRPANAQLPSEVLSGRLLELRNKRGWSQDELASRLSAYDVVWQRTTIAKIEAGTRSVTVDDLVALAFVLGVSPTALMTGTTIGEAVRVAPNTVTDAGFMWLWLNGHHADGGTRPGETMNTGADFSKLEARQRFYDEAGPDFLTSAERRLPGLRAAARTLAQVQTGAACPDRRIADVYPILIEQLVELRDDIDHLLRKARRINKEATK